MKKGNTKFTISVNEKIKDEFKEICDNEGLKPGKLLEIYMLSEIKKREDEKSEE
jgi:antitoxin component of RelBE/YafQ-DinJ toxin-antitoxin module